MRWLFLVMLMLNLSYIAWEISGTPAAREVIPMHDGVADIKLLSELPTTHQQLNADTGVDKAPLITVEAQAVEKEVEGSGFIAESGGQAVANGEEGGVPVAVESQVVAAAVMEKKQAESNSCFTLGPFRELEKLRALTRDIKQYVAEAGFRSRDEKEQSLFWVYIEPLSSKPLAIQTGQQLKAKQIKDFYIIRSDNKKNGISLGHFRNKAGAYRLAERVKKLGFDVIVEPVFKTYTVYWLDYRLRDGERIPSVIIEGLLNDKISRLKRACN